MRRIENWEFSIGIYPGVLFGYRRYKETWVDEHVLYIPFFDISLKIEY
jgi:uncharacterized membrane protein